MPTFTRSRTAAVAVVGFDLLENETYARSPNARQLTGIAYTGSAVVGDTAIDVFVGEVRVGSFFNSALLTPQVNRDIFPMNVPIPAGSQLRATVVDAAATSPVFFTTMLR